MKTLHNIEVNTALLWDQDFTPDKYMDEVFFTWYLGRLLERGTAEEVKKIPKTIIARYLDRLRISHRVRRFWQWHLKDA